MQTKRHQPDYVLLVTVLILTAIGVITVFSASTVTLLQLNEPASHDAVRQLIAGIAGIVILSGLTLFPYRKLYQYAPVILLLNSGLLLLVLIPGIGKSAGGSTRWIGTSSFHIQPSELAIVSITMYLAFFFTKKVTVLHNFKRGFRPALVTVAMITLLIFIEPDMGTSMTLVGTAVVLFFSSGIRLKTIFVTVVPLGGLAYLLSKTASYRSERMLSYHHPFQYAQSWGLQLIQGLTGLASGGWFGRGFDASIEKTGYLPIAHEDFIFSVFTEEWGFIGAMALLAIFAVLVWRGFRIAKHASDRFGSLLAVGLTSMIIIKSFINLSAVTWILPVTGIPLPFISYGGTSLIVNLAAMGMLLSISRETLEVAPEADELADVVYVDDIRELQTKSTRDSLAEVNLFTKRQAKNAGKGQVHTLKTKQVPHTSGWRARQEIASTSTAQPVSHNQGWRKSTKQSSKQADTSNGSTWRSRNQAPMYTPQLEGKKQSWKTDRHNPTKRK